MDNTTIATKEEREKIFVLFIEKRKLKFSEIEKALNIRSNYLDYHIKKLTEEKILEKEGEFYQLTKEAEKLIPFYAHITSKEQGPLSIVVNAIINEKEGKICLLKRKKRPYQGYWGMPGGKSKLEESIKDTALREVEEETGLKCKFDRISQIVHERVKDSGIMKHAFVIFLCRLTTNKTELKEINKDDEGEIQWFDLASLPQNLIPSDKLMIELLSKPFSIKEVVMEDKDGLLKKMEVKDGNAK